jgi:peptide/nickel transport system ATP-binding protein
LLQDLQEELSLSYLFIAHDLSVVQHISDRVAVMYVGKLVETAETEELFFNPKHPYTEALLSAVPIPDPLTKKSRLALRGEVADPANPPSGCIFHPRCKYAQEVCKAEVPELEEVADEHWAACHFARELTLKGAPDESDRTASR